MKKRKILYLFPLAALVLSGCTFEEGWNTTKTWLSDHIWTPILNLFGGKKSDSSDKKQDGGNTPAPSTDSDTEEIVATEVGSVDNPLSVTEFQTLCDANLEYDGLEEGKSATDFAHIAYVTAKVSSNTWNTEGTKIQYLNLVDKDNSSLQITGMFVIVDASVTGDYSAKDSLKGLEVVVKGYPALYNKKNSGKTYELVSKDTSDTENPRLMKVVEPEGTPGVNYGSLEAPLTVSEAKAVIDQENPTAIKMYVQGEVKSNEAWSSQYSNIMRITLTDGANDIVVFKCATFPADVAKESITENSLKGMTALAYGLGELYQSTTYELTAPSIISLSGEVTPPTPVDNFGTLDNPLSIAEAKAVIDAQNPTTQEMYVTGTVKSNTAWNTGTNNSGVAYANMDIVLKDGDNEFTLYRVETLPSEFDTEKPTQNSLVDKIIVAHGTGKLYNTTYELAQGCVVDSIEDPAPIVVESVVLSSEEHIDLQKGQSVKITASVLPAKASQEVEWSLTGEISRSLLSEGPATYDTETNILTAVDTGEATLTATSVADGTVSASCTIEISEATRELTGIEILESEPKLAYDEGDEYGHEGLTVQALYNNGDKADVTDLVEWSYSKAIAEVGDDELVVTATYEENEVVKTDSVTLQVTVAEAHGTQNNPYTCAEARAAVDAGEGVTGVYAGGIVTRIAYAFSNGSMSFYFSDDGSSTNEVEAYKLAATADPGIEVGDRVVVTGNLVKYNSTYEFAEGCTLDSLTKAEVLSVEITGQPQQSEYAVGADYNHNGLSAVAHLDTGVDRDVTASAEWSLSKAHAEENDTSFTVTASYGGKTSDAFVVNVTVSEDAPTLLEASIDFTAQGYTNQQAVTSATFDGFTVTFDKGTNSNAPKYYTSGTAIRVYGSNTVTVTAPSTAEIRGIVIGFGGSDGTNEITADSGTYTNGTWSGTASSVKFTVGGTSGNRRFVSITVSYVNK